MSNVLEQCPDKTPLSRACDALALNRSTVYRRRAKSPVSGAQKTLNRCRVGSPQSRALSSEERASVLASLTGEEFHDQPPTEVYHTLLERGENPCSISSMQRILRENKLNGERRDQRPAQHNAIPRLSASRANEVWTWDCSKLATTTRGVYLTLYTIIDLFSRYVVAWMVSCKENAGLAQQLFDEATARYGIQPGQLTVHQDRGSPMIAHRYIDQMFNQGITLSHSRPRVSNDNAFSEAQFKTLKYQPDYPGKFSHTAHARRWCEEYFDWYNFSHHHSGLAGYTPEQVFTDRYHQVAEQKQAALDARYQRNPERFVKGRPVVKMPPNCVQINPVTEQEIEEGASSEVNFPTLNRVKDKYKVTSI